MGAPAVRAGHPFAGGPHLMGVVNVTPDSFSDGGRFFNPGKAIEHGIELARQGASILDVGGESTRPGAHPVDIKEEISRIVSVLQGLRSCAPWLSVDTRNAATMEAALEAGATMINDVSALTHDPRSIAVAAASHVPVVLMHMQGTPENMQKNPIVNNGLEIVFNYLKEKISDLESQGIDRNRIIIDPGIGFGKSLEQNILILSKIRKFHDLNVPILLGVSRKSLIAGLSEGETADERLPGSLAAALWGLSQGVQIFRVHDVAATAQAFRIHQAIAGASE